MMSYDRSILNVSRRGGWVISILLSLVIISGGYWYFRYESEKIRQEKFELLAAIGKLKVDQLVRWRKERLGDARRLAFSSFFKAAVADLVRNPQSIELQEQLRQRLLLEQESYGYSNAIIIDPTGKVLVALTPNNDPIGKDTLQINAQAFERKTAVLSDLYRCRFNHIHIDTIAPMFDEQGQPLASVVLRSDAATFLFPMISSWPTPSKSAETLLIRQDGDKVLFLNELRHREDTALSLSIPMSRKDVPAVQAIEGRSGVFLGNDYRGVKVITILLPIPGSDWHMVAKVDASEVLAEARYRATAIVLIVIVVIMLLGVMAAFWDRKQRASIFQELYHAERKMRESQEKFRTILYSIGDAVITTDKTGQVQQMNPVAETLTGWKEPEAIKKPLASIFKIVNEQTRIAVDNPVERVLDEGDVVGLANHTILISKEGIERPISDSGAPIRDENGDISGVVLVFRDQTEERHAKRLTSARFSIIEYSATHTSQEILSQALDVISAHVDSPIGFFHTLADDQRTLTLQQWSTNTRNNFCQVREKDTASHYDIDQAGVWVDCVYQRRPVVHNNYASLAHKKGIPEGHPEVVRDLVVPVFREGKIVAILGVGNKAAEYTDRDVEIVSFLADVTWESVLLKKKEDELANTAKEWQTTYNASSDAIFILSKEQRIIRCNRAAEEFFQLDRVNIVGMHCWELVHGTDGPIVGCPYLVTKQSMGRETMELEVGDEWFQVNVDPLLDSSGEFNGAVHFISKITGRKKAEIALRESERQIRTLIDNLPGMTYRCKITPEWHMDFFSDGAIDLLGYKPEAGKLNFGEYIHPDDKQRVWETVKQAIDTDRPFEMEYRIITKTGQEKWVWEKGRAVATEKSNEPVLEGFISDITQRKLADQTARENEEKFQTITEAAPDAIFIINKEGDYLYANSAATKLLGYSADEILQLNIGDVGTQDSSGLRFQKLKEKGTLHTEMTLRKKDGALVDVDLNAVILPNGMLYGSCRDLTARNEAEAEVLKEKEFTDRALAAQMDTFMLCEYESGKPLRFNRAFTDITGYTEEEIESMPVPDSYFNAEDSQRIKSFVANVSEDKNSTLEAELICKNGDRIPFEYKASYIRNGSGDPEYIIWVGRDIAERKRIEAEQAMLEQQLAQSQKLESVGRLAGGVAHDFNNMLGAILGYTEIALEQLPPDHPIRNDLVQIHLAAERSTNLTRQLLAFARKQTVRPQPLDLNDTLPKMLKMLQRLIGEEIDLRWEPGHNLWNINIDPSQIDQILANMAVNARDAIEGVGQLTIETANVTIDEEYCANHREAKPGEYVQLAISDDGSGMDREMREHIFEPFFTTKETGEGTGLGLAMVYGIVKQNKGFINLYSEPGQGTTFRLYFPRIEQQIARTEADEVTTSPPRGSETILIVEDEQAILKLGQRILEGLGYTVLAAKSPTEALSRIKEFAGDIQLLITDVVMPEMNGRDLAGQLTQLAPNMKCLYMSGYTANVIAHRGVLDDDVNFLQKPFSVINLASKVREVLDKD